MMRIHWLFGVSAALVAAPVTAQVRSAPVASASPDQDDDEALTPQQQQQQTPLETNRAGRTARSSVGQVGQRQTRDTAAAQAGIKPMARIASRIQNRVQNRVRNRIDRDYDPLAGATDPFAVAEDQARTTGRPR